MRINTREQCDGDGQFLPGTGFGFHASVLIHETANLIGDIDIGPNTRIDGFVTITGNVKIGRNCHIATGASIFGGNGVVIGNHCGISAGCRLFTGTDDPRQALLNLHSENELRRGGINGPIDICDFVVIGANSVIMPHVTISDGAIVGALSFVPVDSCLQKNYIYGGIPVRFLGERHPLGYAL